VITKIFDCSNGPGRPPHRGMGGPIENDIMRYLKKYSNHFDCQFVETLKDANVAITNDVFTKEVAKSNIPKIKRMDGIYWQKKFIERNEPLNSAAFMADHVIFISNYSKNQFYDLYGFPLKAHSVVLNVADPREYYPGKPAKKVKSYFGIAATNWTREEKRFRTLNLFSDLIFSMLPTSWILCLGKMPINREFPPNLSFRGIYNSPEEFRNLLFLDDQDWKAQGFLNFSYRDAAPKVVAQALSCGLPVLYADNGGVKEMVRDCGIGFNESSPDKFFQECCPHTTCNINILFEAIHNFINRFEELSFNISVRKFNEEFDDMLRGYFDIIKKYA